MVFFHIFSLIWHRCRAHINQDSLKGSISSFYPIIIFFSFYFLHPDNRNSASSLREIFQEFFALSLDGLGHQGFPSRHRPSIIKIVWVCVWRVVENQRRRISLYKAEMIGMFFLSICNHTVRINRYLIWSKREEKKYEKKKFRIDTEGATTWRFYAITWMVYIRWCAATTIFFLLPAIMMWWSLLKAFLTRFRNDYF